MTDATAVAKLIFERAAEIVSPSERAAYVKAACGGDAVLQAAVEELLTAAENADSSMRQPAVTLNSTVLYQPLSERPGATVGPYKLMEQIGEGGFGLVFVAEQQRPVRRKVALKIIKPGMDTSDVIARFEAERQALALMDHPNIAKVFDAGATDSGRPYFVMELVRGIPMTDYSDQNQLAPRQRLELFYVLCQAIQHAHQKGIIHRDVKPSNVLVTSHDGKPVVKVIDFGVAKALGQQLTEKTIYTQFAQVIGTPLYMSPEQAQLSGLDIDTRADIYSLGVLLYELLTGTTPFDRQRLKSAALDEICRIIREEDPPKPSTRISQSGDRLASIAALRKTEPTKLSKLVRGDLDWIAMKCLEKDRTRRYESASGLARDIERYLNDEPVEACPPTNAYRLRKFTHKHRAAIVTAGAFIALLVAGVVASSWQAIRASQAKQQAIEERDAKETARREALASAQQARDAATAERSATSLAERNLYVARMNLVDKALKSGNYATAERLLNHYRPGSTLEHLRAFEWFHWRSVCSTVQSGAKQLSEEMRRFLVLSPDGKKLATLECISASQVPDALFVWDLQTGRRKQLDSHFCQPIAFSSDGQRLVTVGTEYVTGDSFHRAIAVWNVDTGKKVTEIPTGQSPDAIPPNVAFWSSDRRIVANVENKVVFWNAATGKQEQILGNRSVRILAIALSADGESLAAGYEDGDIQIWNPNSPELLKTFRAHDSAIGSILFLPTSNQLVTRDTNSSVKVWNLAETKSPTWEFKGEPCSTAVSSDGQTLLWGERNGLLHAIDLKTGEEFVRIQIATEEALEFFPGGIKFAASGGRFSFGFWELVRRRVRTILNHEAFQLTFTTDSKTVASISSVQIPSDELSAWLSAGLPPKNDIVATGPWTRTGEIKVWNAQTGQLLRSFEGKSSDRETFIFMADGKPLASFRHKQAASIRLPPDNDRGVRSDFHDINLAKFTAGEPLAALADQPTHLAQFSPNRKWLAVRMDLFGTPAKGGLIELWDVDTRTRIKTFSGHTDSVWWFAFSPDGSTLASASEDCTVRLWDVVTGEEKATFNFPESVNYVGFSPDGQILWSATLNQVTFLHAVRDEDAASSK